MGRPSQAAIALALFFTVVTSASAASRVTLAKETDRSVLYGNPSAVRLIATNAPGASEPGYNLTIRDVLPVGVSLASSQPAPTSVVEDAPKAGQTTVIWQNLADLPPASSFAVSYSVRHAPSTIAVSTTYTNSADAYTNTNPRVVPSFDEAGRARSSTFDDTDTATARTTVEALQVTKEEPSPEGELLRGLHDHVTTYTLDVHNNNVARTTGVALDDYLPANLEFLGCGGADHTTEAPTNPGSTEEYAGSGPLGGSAPSRCIAPDEVETVNIDPDGAGPLKSGVYTHLRWSATTIGTLAVDEHFVTRYLAAVPLRTNTLDWPNGKPTTASGQQGSNLDNNSGSPTAESGATEPTATNYALATGRYDDVLAVRDDTSLTRTVEDLRVLKSAGTESLSIHASVRWTLQVDTSEYRTADAVQVVDKLPTGLCPVGPTANYAGDAECAAGPYMLSPAFSKAPVENADGSWNLVWEIPAIDRSGRTTIVFTSRTRNYYQADGADTRNPILAFDSIENTVAIDGKTHRAYPPDTRDGGARADDRNLDVSAAGLDAQGPSLDKKIGTRQDPWVGCSTARQSYVETQPVFHPGDRMCFKIRIEFPAGLAYGSPKVVDFLPPGTRYVAGTEAATADDTIATAATFDASDPTALRWQIGRTLNEPATRRVFERVFAVDIIDPAAGVPGQIPGNLLKLSVANTTGQSFPLRDGVDYAWAEPTVTLVKGVRDVDDAPASGYAPNTDGATVRGGQIVTYRIDLSNSGTADASRAEIRDDLPAAFTCADVVSKSISDRGSCTGATITWSDVSIPAGAAVVTGSQKTLTYDVKVPDTVTVGTTYTNRAGVRTYFGPSNTDKGGFQYFPANNIDPKVKPNTDPADDGSNVVPRAVSVAKAQTTELDEPGNSKPTQATVGEEITYEVTATIAEGTTLRNGELIEDFPPDTTFIAVDTATLNGTALPSAVKLSTSNTGITIALPKIYLNAAGSGDDVIRLVLRVRVDDVAAVKRGSAVSNQARFTATGAATSRSQKTTAVIVEPNLAIAKSDDRNPGTVIGNDLVTYTLSLTNASAPGNVSPAHDVVVLDRLPAGLEPIDAEGVAVAGGAVVPPDGGVWNGVARTITWRLAKIDPDTIRSLRYRVRVIDPVVPQTRFPNTVTTDGTSLGNGLDDDGERTKGTGYQASAKDELHAGTDPRIAKSVVPDAATIGQRVTYTLKVEVPARTRLFDAVALDTLPANLRFDRYVSAACTAGCLTGDAQPDLLVPLANTPANGKTRIGWGLGDLDAATGDRAYELVYAAYLADTPNRSGITFENAAQLAWNLIDAGNPRPGQAPRTTQNTGVTLAAVRVIEPHITIDKDVAAQRDDTDERDAEPGTRLTYTIRVTNDGTSAAYDIDVADRVSNLLTDVTFDGSEPAAAATLADGWTADDPAMRWLVPGPLRPGESATLAYSATLIASGSLHDGDRIPNTAHVPAYRGLPESERVGVSARTYTEDPGDKVTVTVRTPRLEISKSLAGAPFDEDGPAEIGIDFGWRIVVRNTSSVATAYGVNVTDSLPPNFAYVASSTVIVPGSSVEPAVAADGRTLTWAAVRDLGPGATMTITIATRPTTDARTGDNPHENLARADAIDGSGATGDADGPYATGDDRAAAILTRPRLVLTKTPDGDAYAAGSPTVYAIKVENTGDALARDLVVEDVFPDGVVYACGTATSDASGFAEPTCAGDTPTAGATSIRWTATRLDPGSTITINVPATVRNDQNDGTRLVNSATVTSKELPDPTTKGQSDTGAIEVRSAPNLVAGSLKSAVPATPAGEPFTEVRPADRIAYTIAFRNDGNETARSLIVEDAIPEHTTFVPGSAAAQPPVTAEYLVGGSWRTTEPTDPSRVLGIRWQIGTLSATTPANAGTVAFAVTVDTPLDGGTRISNSATITTSRQPDGLALGPVTHEVASRPVLSAQKAASAERIIVNTQGSEITYAIEVVNTGDMTATGVYLEDIVPNGTTLASVSAPDMDAVECSTDVKPGPFSFGACPTAPATTGVTALRWHAAALEPGRPVRVGFTVNATLPAADGTAVANVAAIGSTQTEPVQSNEVTTTLITSGVIDFAKSVTPTGDVRPGDRLTYDLAVASSGSQDLGNVVLEDPVPANTTYAAGSASSGAEFKVGDEWQAAEPDDPAAVLAVRWRFPTIGIGERMAVGFAVLVNALVDRGATVTNTATTSADGLEPSIRTVDNPVVSGVAVSISKTAGSSVVALDGQTNWKIHVVVSGTATANPLIVRDDLPVELAFLSATDGGTLHNGAVVWDLGLREPGTELDLYVTTRLALLPGRDRLITNAATADAGPNGAGVVGSEAQIEAIGNGDCPRGGSIQVGVRRLIVGVRTPVRVAVRNADGTPAVGVGVTAGKSSGVTDGDGIATLIVRGAKAGTKVMFTTNGCGWARVRVEKLNQCAYVRVSPDLLDVGRRTAIVLKVRIPRAGSTGRGDPMTGIRFSVRGAGIRASGITNQLGTARIRVRATRVGVVRISSSACSCIRRLGASDGGSGGQLTR